MGELAKIDSFKREVAIVETIEEAKLLTDKGELMALMAKKLNIPIKGQNELGRTRIELEKKKRELIEQLFPKGGDRKSNLEITSLKSVGITFDESSDAKIIKEEDRLVDDVINEIEQEQKEVITPKAVASRVRKKKKQIEKEQQIKEGAKIQVLPSDIDIRCGNFISVLDDIPDNSLDIIITDPPYPFEFIQSWSDLSLFAGKKLKENGFCIAYSGQTNLVEVINRMSENLSYYWTFALIHSGNKQLINHRNIFCGWKPLLVFQNGLKKREYPCEDIITGSGLEKEYHRWQQAEAELVPIIEHFTKPGNTICDPFLGGGTTAVVSYELKRKFIGAEIDEGQFNIAKKRIYEYDNR